MYVFINIILVMYGNFYDKIRFHRKWLPWQTLNHFKKNEAF